MIFGTVINPELEDEIVVTVIATGFKMTTTKCLRSCGTVQDADDRNKL